MVGKAGASGTSRNPEKYCTGHKTNGEQCKAYALVGLDVCRVHGGSTPGAVEARVKQEIVQMVGALGIPEPVKIEDFPEVATQYVGMLNQMCSGLLSSLRELTEHENDVDMARQYSDILDRINATVLLVTKMMTAVAALRLSLPKPDVNRAVPPADLLRQALEGVNQRLGAIGQIHTKGCPDCGYLPPLPKIQRDDRPDAEVIDFPDKSL